MTHASITPESMSKIVFKYQMEHHGLPPSASDIALELGRQDTSMIRAALRAAVKAGTLVQEGNQGRYCRVDIFEVGHE